jgi:hypothetical protein
VSDVVWQYVDADGDTWGLDVIRGLGMSDGLYIHAPHPGAWPLLPRHAAELRDVLAKEDPRVTEPGIHYTVHRDGHGRVCVWRWVGPDDPRPQPVGHRPHESAPPAAQVGWRALLAGFGLADIP